MSEPPKEARPGALKRDPKNALLSSPLQGPGLKTAKVEEGVGTGSESSGARAGFVAAEDAPKDPGGFRYPFPAGGLPEVAPFPNLTGGPGPEIVESDGEEPSMRDLMKMMKKMDVKVDSINHRFTVLYNEIQAMKAEMVTKDVFSSLEVRVKKLESDMSGISSGVGSGSSGQVSFLQEQVNRLDPANKCLSFNSWTSKSTSGRKALIESYVEGICPGTTT